MVIDVLPDVPALSVFHVVTKSVVLIASACVMDTPPMRHSTKTHAPTQENKYFIQYELQIRPKGYSIFLENATFEGGFSAYHRRKSEKIY